MEGFDSKYPGAQIEQMINDYVAGKFRNSGASESIQVYNWVWGKGADGRGILSEEEYLKVINASVINLLLETISIQATIRQIGGNITIVSQQYNENGIIAFSITINPNSKEYVEEILNVPIGGNEDGIHQKRIIACVLRYDGKQWTMLDNDGHSPISVESVEGNSPDTVTIRFPKYSKVNSLVCTPDETLAAAGIKCGASVGLDYATIHVRQDRMVRLMVTTNSAGNGGSVSRQEWDTRTNIDNWKVSVVTNTSLGNYLKVEDANGSIDGTAIPTIGGGFTSYLLGSKPGYMNVQLRNPDGSVSDYKGVSFQVGWPILNGIPIFTEYELGKGNIWVYGIMME